jgi:hypothetical protein
MRSSGSEFNEKSEEVEDKKRAETLFKEMAEARKMVERAEGISTPILKNTPTTSLEKEFEKKLNLSPPTPLEPRPHQPPVQPRKFKRPGVNRRRRDPRQSRHSTLPTTVNPGVSTTRSFLQDILNEIATNGRETATYGHEIALFGREVARYGKEIAAYGERPSVHQPKVIGLNSKKCAIANTRQPLPEAVGFEFSFEAPAKKVTEKQRPVGRKTTTTMTASSEKQEDVKVSNTQTQTHKEEENPFFVPRSSRTKGKKRAAPPVDDDAGIDAANGTTVTKKQRREGGEDKDWTFVVIDRSRKRMQFPWSEEVMAKAKAYRED